MAEKNDAISIRASDNSIVRMECHTRLNSAASLAKEYAHQGFPDRYVVVCEYENDRDGDARGLYMSCILRPSIFPSQASLLSSLAVAAFATALEEHTVKKLGIGWVSSIYCEGRMIGNVGIEGKLDNFTSYEYIIVNFSVKLSDEDFPPRLSDLVKKVFESDNNSVTTLIAKTVLNKFFLLYSNMRNDTKYMNIYRQKFILGGVKIKRILDNGHRASCKVLGINNEYCTLIVEATNGKIEEITNPAQVVIPKYIKPPKK